LLWSRTGLAGANKFNVDQTQLFKRLAGHATEKLNWRFQEAYIGLIMTDICAPG
jgi:hypothetical protein